MSVFQHLKIEQTPNNQVFELLEQNIIGTPGKSILYQHRDVRSKIKALTNPFFANLSIRDHLYGTICLSNRNVHSLGRHHQAYYLRYFTFRDSIRTVNPKNHRRKTPSTVREDINKLMNGEGLDLNEELVLYAYVDVDNVRSKRLIDEFGFKKVGMFSVISYSRFFPKTNPNFQELEQKQRKQMQHLLSDFYKSDLLVVSEEQFERGKYFVLKKKGEIICGVLAISDGWIIKKMPGFFGKVMMNLVPKLPLFKKLFNPSYNFVFLERIYCRAGSEKHLEDLFESVLSYYDLNSGVICIDHKSKLYPIIKGLKLGLTHKIMGENKNEIVLKTNDQALLNSSAPFYISGYDVL